jgi:predicted RNA-binding Zn-ribbon protein involved in translation (DUF1610 family)
MLTFRCPNCGSLTLEELWSNVLEVRIINFIDDSGEKVSDSHYNVSDEKELVGYFCGDCKEELINNDGTPVYTYDDLLEYLRRQSHNNIIINTTIMVR